MAGPERDRACVPVLGVPEGAQEGDRVDAEGWYTWAWSQQNQSSAAWDPMNPAESQFLIWKVDTMSVVRVRSKCYQVARMTALL